MNKVLIISEGKHEDLLIKDAIKNKYAKKIDNFEFIYLRDEMPSSELHLNRLSALAGTLSQQYDCIFAVVADTDDENANKSIEEGVNVFKNNDVKTILLKQQPFLEAFLASFFNEFHIAPTDLDSKESITLIKDKANEFLANKFGKSVYNMKWIKKITITHILKKGGTIENAKRYEEFFDLAKYL